MTIDRSASFAAAALHAAVLGLVGWAGGSAQALAVVAGLVGSQLVESAAAPDRVETADRSAQAIGLGILAVVVLSLGAPGAGTPLGWVLWAGGLGLRLWAIRTLGPRFLDGVALLPGHVRSVDGPYRWLSHPADLGMLAMTAGIVAILGSASGFALWTVGLVPLLAWRTASEDRLWISPR